VEVDLSGEQRFLQETVRKFLEQESPLSSVRERASKGEPPFDASYWRQAAELGWTAMLIPEEHGGAAGEHPVLDLVIVAEEMGRQIAPGPFLPSAVVIDALLRAGSPEQQQEHLPALADGSCIATWALAEAPDMWEPAEVSTQARRDGDSYVLSGEKSAVEAADVADVFLVTGRTPEGLAQFLVPRDTNGLSIRGLPQYDLGRVFGDITLQDVRVPASAMIGEPGNIGDCVEHQFLLALTLLSAETVGLTEKIFDVTIDYARDRYAFGRPIASYQALKHRIADHKLWLEAGLGLSTALAHALDGEQEDTARLASVTKAHVGEQSLQIISDCSQLTGGIAQTWEHDMHLYLRRATVNQFLYGSATQHKERLCRLIGL